MPDLRRNQLAHAQELKEQCRFKEALNTLSFIEHVDTLPEDEQIKFYLLQSSLCFHLDQYQRALDSADWVFQRSLETGNDLVMLDASLARGNALNRLAESAEIYKSILKCEELFSRIKDLPENIIGKRKMVFSFLKGWYYLNVGKTEKSLEQAKLNLALSEKYGTKQEKMFALHMIGVSYMGTSDFIKGLENIENYEKLSKELDFKKGMAWASYRKGRYYNHMGKTEKSLEHFKTFLDLSEKYGTKFDMVLGFRSLGSYHVNTGDFTKALEYFEKALKVSREFKFRSKTAQANSAIGYIYHQRGDLDRGLEYYELSLSIFEEIGNRKLGRASALEDIGLILYEKGDLDKSLNYQKKSLQLRREIGNDVPISLGLFNIIPIYLEQNDLESAQMCLEELKQLNELKENRGIARRFRIAQALILKKIGGTRNIVRAEDILNDLLEEKFIDNDIEVIILLNLCELLNKEVQITNEAEILEEITPLITRLLEISEKMHSFSLLAEVYLFKAKFELINFQIMETQQLLTRAQQITQQYQLPRLEKKISLEHDQLINKLELWKELKNQNAPLSERLKIVSLEGDLNLMMRKQEIEPVEILPEEPLMLSIISKGGVSFFMHIFSKEWEENQMFGSFMTAFNAFSHEFFAKTLDRVKIGENTIIMVPFEDKFLCYVIKGQTYPAQQKLNTFSEGIKNSKEILDAINRCFSTGAVLDERNSPVLAELVNSIFIR